MADVEKRRPSAGPVIGMVVVILVILGLGFWFLARDRDNTADKGLTDAGDSLKLSGVIYDSTAAGPTGRTTRGVGAGLTAAEAPLFEGRDIHDVPLGVILDYAQRLTYDEARGHELTLARNSRGQAARVRIWPEGGASSQEGSTLKLGRIVARIESDGAYEDLGLAGRRPPARKTSRKRRRSALGCGARGDTVAHGHQGLNRCGPRAQRAAALRLSDLAAPRF